MTALTLRAITDGEAGAAIRSLGGDERSAVVYDGRVPGAAAAAAGVRRPVGAPIDLSLATPDLGELAARVRRGSPTTLVAIGGGTTLDAVKLARLGAADPALLAHVLRSREHRALIMLPRSSIVLPRLIAVPTTVGTSSEVNAVAITTSTRGHRLVVGVSLRPSAAVHSGALLTSLPLAAVREGCFEALLRVAGLASGAARVTDAAVGLAVDLVRAGEGSLSEPRDLLRAARLAAATQNPALRVGGVFAPKHWYVANEVSFALGVRKVPATAPIVPAVWRRIDDGDRRWGDRDGLRAVWHAVACAADLPQPPAAGVAALIRRWRLAAPMRPTVDQIVRIASASEVAWGATRPALRGIRAADVAAVLRDGAWSARASAERETRPALAGARGGDNR